MLQLTRLGAAALIGTLAAWAAPVAAAPLEFEFVATIDSSYLTQFNDPKAPHGSDLHGFFSYDPDLDWQLGDSHYFDSGEGALTVFTDEGFNLSMDNRVTNVSATGSGDFFTVQSYVSESPNDWHIVLDIAAQDWLGGSNALPTSFPDAFDFAYVSVYFTDEGDWVRTIDATLRWIRPAGGMAPIPLPPTGLAVLSALLGLGLYRRWGNRRARPARATA